MSDEDLPHRARQRGLPEETVVSDRDHVIELDVPWYPEPGAPECRLWVDRSGPAQTVVLVYAAGPFARTEERYVVLRFPGCWFASLGPPGHNGFELHPLAANGLQLYGVFEILNSTAYELHGFVGGTLADQHRADHPGSGSVGNSRHFVVTFHDEMFQCFAGDMLGEFTSDLSGAFSK